MDQGSNKNHSPAYNFTPTVTKFCVMWEGLSLPHDTKFGNCRCNIVDIRSFHSWSLIHGLRWSGLIKVGPGHQQQLYWLSHLSSQNSQRFRYDFLENHLNKHWKLWSWESVSCISICINSSITDVQNLAFPRWNLNGLNMIFLKINLILEIIIFRNGDNITHIQNIARLHWNPFLIWFPFRKYTTQYTNYLVAMQLKV